MMTSVQQSEFRRKLFEGLLRDYHTIRERTVDPWIYAKRMWRIKRRLKDRIVLLAKRYGFVWKNTPEGLLHALQHLDGLERFYNLLQDDYSRELSIELLKSLILGEQYVKLPTDNEAYWRLRASLDSRYLQRRHTARCGETRLNQYEVPGLEGPIRLHALPLTVLNDFLLEQYAYRKGSRVVQAQPGDVVIDGGGCWGETALYFADRTGAQGQIHCFEFDQDNLQILKQNLELNRHLASRTAVVHKALWDESGKTMGYHSAGVATKLEGEKLHGRQAQTISIDDFVAEEGIARVDYIKLDIEGSELRALQGAEGTLRAFRPNLAVAVYHSALLDRSLEDFVMIPNYLSMLGLGYEFFLDHFSVHAVDTILFAAAIKE
jgi:FkbM family methyltransferase